LVCSARWFDVAISGLPPAPTPVAGETAQVMRRVLVVDDEPDIVELLTIWLDDDPRCSHVFRANDLDGALALATEKVPEIVVLDFCFGHRLATEILPPLRAACPDALIVVHTGSRRAAEMSGVLQAGADRIVEKGAATIEDVVDGLFTAVRV
jgi:DNA-binding NarL/FixJ family response regulator